MAVAMVMAGPAESGQVARVILPALGPGNDVVNLEPAARPAAKAAPAVTIEDRPMEPAIVVRLERNPLHSESSRCSTCCWSPIRRRGAKLAERRQVRSHAARSFTRSWVQTTWA